MSEGSLMPPCAPLPTHTDKFAPVAVPMTTEALRRGSLIVRTFTALNMVVRVCVCVCVCVFVCVCVCVCVCVYVMIHSAWVRERAEYVEIGDVNTNEKPQLRHSGGLWELAYRGCACVGRDNRV